MSETNSLTKRKHQPVRANDLLSPLRGTKEETTATTTTTTGLWESQWGECCSHKGKKNSSNLNRHNPKTMSWSNSFTTNLNNNTSTQGEQPKLTRKKGRSKSVQWKKFMGSSPRRKEQEQETKQAGTTREQETSCNAPALHVWARDVDQELNGSMLTHKALIAPTPALGLAGMNTRKKRKTKDKQSSVNKTGNWKGKKQ